MGGRNLASILLLFITILVIECYGQGYKDEQKLIKNLIHRANYNKHLRPAMNASDTVRVDFGLALLQILDLDETNQVLHTLVWIRTTWKDARLAWDSKKYGGITDIRIPPEMFWKPDIVLYNNAHDKWEYTVEPMGVLYNDGSILFIPPMQVHSSCSIELFNFPYDIQVCHLKFGSWTYDGNKVSMSFYENTQNVDLTDYIPSQDWDIIENKAVNNIKYYPCCQEPYPDITYTLKLRRRSAGHFTYTLLAPSVVLALLIPVLFLLPSTSGEKVPLGVGIILGLILLAIMIQSLLPNTGTNSFSALAVYNLSCVVLAAVSIALSALVNGMWFKVSEAPEFVKSLVNEKLGRLVCVLATRYRRKRQEARSDSDVMLPTTDTKGLNEWQIFSIVVDRFLFVIFLFCVIVITIVMY